MLMVAFVLCSWAILDSNISLETPSSDQVLALSSIPLSGVLRGGLGVSPPQISNALQNHAKLSPIVKTVNDWFERIMWEVLITSEQAVT